MNAQPRRSEKPGMSRAGALALVTGMLGVTAVLGMRNAPDPIFHPRIRRWYKRLDKPSYTPPDPVFGAVWPVLETGLAVGGYRLMRSPPSPARNLAVGLWVFNVGMIGGWAEIFFRKKELGLSAVSAGAMVATGAGLVASSARVDRTAAATAVPFVAWLAFATLLAERIWEKNESRSEQPA
jgi:tryptophan-rich sensory protein